MKIIPSSRKNRYIAGVIILLAAIALIVWLVSWLSAPSEIRDWYDLNAVRDNLRSHYILMNSIDFLTPGYEELASETANQGKGWQPIGTSGNPFTGTFDGQGYAIRYLSINRPDELGVGLFGEVGQEGVIKNIGVVVPTVNGGIVGGLVGANGGTVSNSYSASYSTGSVTGTGGVGGLVGANGGTVSNCYATGSVTGTGGVGGLVGLNQNDGIVSDSYSTGSVTGTWGVGCLVGLNQDESTVSNSYATGSVTGNSSVGGLVGVNSATVSNSYSTSSVTGNENVGCLVGFNGNDGTVSNSYSTGSVTGNVSVGGLVGRNGGTVSDSYSTGSVTGNVQVGGLVGVNSATVSNSFWDTETSGQATSDGGTGKNTTEMKDIATSSGAGWNITAVTNLGTRNPSYVWSIVDNVTYPLLSWYFGYPQGHTSPTQIETETIPSGYFILTVSPAEVCANIGEQIEIRCNIQSLINCIIEISSVDVLLFDSYDSMIREQAMTRDSYSYWSAHTVYTIVGDEAYYQLKVNFTFPGGKPKEHSEYGAHSFLIVVNQNR